MPDDPNVSGIERMLRALVARERLANGLSVEARQRQMELFHRIERILQRIDPTGAGPQRHRRMREAAFLDEVTRLLRDFAPEFEATMKSGLAQIGRAEAVRAQVDIIATLGAVGSDVVKVNVGITQARMRAILNTDPFRGRTLREHAERMSVNTLDRVRTELRLGMAAEESTRDIVRRIRGRVLDSTQRETEALVRTAVTFVSNEGMLETFRDNAEVVAGVRFVAALDDRTTAICLSLDGTVWKPGDPTMARPPLHYNCRSILVPEMDWEALGLTPPPEPVRMSRDMSTVDDTALGRTIAARRRDRIASGTGLGEVKRVPSSVTGERWFRDQRAAVQDRIVGRTRAEAFRRGEIKSLKDLIAGDNTVIPLSELGL